MRLRSESDELSLFYDCVDCLDCLTELAVLFHRPLHTRLKFPAANHLIRH